MKPAWLLTAALAACTLFYVCYKAAADSFTHDESYTYTRYVYKSFWDIITYNASDVIPNNHILNTLLMKIFEGVFGSSELALRLPNMLAYVAFLFCSLLWLRRFNSPWILVTGFLALHANPFLLDFFALARGYGLSVSFLFISFYFFYNYILFEKKKHLTGAFLFAALAVWSSFILLNYYLALWLVFNILAALKVFKGPELWPHKIKRLLAANGIPLLVSAVLGTVIFQSLITISGDLFGPSNGFWSNTVRTLAYFSTNTKMGMWVDYLCYFIALILILSVIFFLVDFFKKSLRSAHSPYIFCFLLMVTSAGMTILQHLVLQVPFLENRTGLFFIALFNINVVCLVYVLRGYRRLHLVGTLLSGVYALFLVYNLGANGNLDSHVTWEYDSRTKDMLKALEADVHARNGVQQNQVSLGITWLFEPTINFYRQTHHLSWLKEVNRDGYKGAYDYYYIENDSAFIDSTRLTVVKKFDEIQTALARNDIQK